MNRGNKAKKLSICIIMLFITLIISPNTNSYAAWNNNAIDFVNIFGEQNALYKDGSFWFGQWGTSNGTIKYRIIGWQISIKVGNKNYNVNSKVGGTTKVVDERFLSGTNRLYTLWKIDYNTIVSKLKTKYPNVDFSELADRTKESAYKFNAIMTTGIVTDGQIINQGAIDDDGNKTSGTVYYDLSGILGAANWTGTAPAEISKLFDIPSSVSGSQKPSYNEEYAPINNNLTINSYDYKENDKIYWVKPNKEFNIYMDGYIPSSSFVYPTQNTVNFFEGSDKDYKIDLTTSDTSITDNFKNNFNLSTSKTKSYNENSSSKNYLKSNIFMSAKYDNKDYLIKYFSEWKSINRGYKDSGIWVKTDGTAPVVSGYPSSNWTKENIKFTLTGTDSRSGMNSVVLQENGQQVNTGTSSITYTASKEGITTYKIVAEDNVGNVSEKEFEVKIDKTAPTISGYPNSNWTKNNVSFTLSGTDTGSGMKIMTLYENGLKVKTGTSSITHTASKEGITTYKIVAEDNVGNISEKEFIVKIDKTAPTISGYPNSEWTKNNVSFTLSSTDTGSGMKIMTLYENGLKVKTGTSSITYTASKEGITTYKIVAEDNVGNISEKEFEVKIDRTAPIGDVNYDYNETTIDMEITVSNIVETGSGVDKIWVEYSDKNNPDNKKEITLQENSGGYEGTHNLYDIFNGSIDEINVVVKAKDKVGNEGILSQHEVDIFKITATIERVLSPHDPIFKGGEKGVIKINMYGGVDKLKITFPLELTDLDSSLNAEIDITPKKNSEHNYEFFVPLYALEKGYNVQVKGFRNTREKEVYPRFSVRGSILNDIRTRVRIQ